MSGDEVISEDLNERKKVIDESQVFDYVVDKPNDKYSMVWEERIGRMIDFRQIWGRVIKMRRSVDESKRWAMSAR